MEEGEIGYIIINSKNKSMSGSFKVKDIKKHFKEAKEFCKEVVEE
jgi:hypothetical protein